MTIYKGLGLVLLGACLALAGTGCDGDEDGAGGTGGTGGTGGIGG